MSFFKSKRPSPRRTPTRTRPPVSPGTNPAYPPPGSSPEYPQQTPPTLPGRYPPIPPSTDPQVPPGYPPPTYPPPGLPGPSYPPPAPPPVYHPLPPGRPGYRRRERPRRLRWRFRPGCLVPVFLLILLLTPLALYLFAPVRTNVMIIGIDYVDPATSSALARSDTIMMATILPSQPYIGLISIPRDLWVTIPNFGENRINTAHFYAESVQPGSGPQALRKTIALNFGVDIPYYVRIRFESVREIVEAMGGVDIQLTEPMAGYPAGKHHLTGRKALAFIRDRSGSDDFFRMGQGQHMIRAMIQNMLTPQKWPRIPAVTRAFMNSVDTNIPISLWPRLGFALLRAGPNGIDSRIITREMATPITRADGAMVLTPHWPAIHTLVKDVFQ